MMNEELSDRLPIRLRLFLHGIQVMLGFGIYKHIKALDSKDESVCKDAVDSLVKIGEPAVLPLIYSLPTPRMLIVSQILIKIGEPAVPALMKVLHPKNFYRGEAVKILGKIGSSAIGATDALIETLKNDRDAWVRRRAANALGNIMDSKAIPALMEALKDMDFYVRGDAARALGTMNAVIAIDSLIALLEDDRYVIEGASFALGQLNATVAIDKLIVKTQHEYVEVRRAVARDLGKLKAHAAVPALIKLLNDGDKSVRTVAMESLAEIQNTDAIEPLIKLLSDPDIHIHWPASHALEKFGYNAIPSLVDALRSGNKDAFYCAAKAIRTIIENSNDIDKLDRIGINIKEMMAQSKGSPYYQHLRNLVQGLLTLINARKNALIAVDISLDRKPIELPKKPEGGIYRIQRPQRLGL